MPQGSNAKLKSQLAQANKNAGNAAPVAANQDFESLLMARKDKIAEILPETMNVERFMRVVISQRNTNPALRECEALSVMSACALSAQMGLEPGPHLGLAYLVPFKEKGVPKAQFQIGYKGYIALARRSNEIAIIIPGVIGEKDHYVYKKIDPKTLNTYLEHDIAKDGDSGKSIAFYVITHYKDGAVDVKFMYRPEIERFRKRSKAPNSPAWTNDYDAMAIKTVCRRAATFWPLTIEASTAIKADGTVSSELASNMVEDAAMGNTGDYIDVEVVNDDGEPDAPEGRSDALQTLLEIRDEKLGSRSEWIDLKHNTLSDPPEDDNDLTDKQISALFDALSEVQS